MSGRSSNVVVIRATDDVDAIEQARMVVDRAPVSVYFGGKHVKTVRRLDFETKSTQLTQISARTKRVRS